MALSPGQVAELTELRRLLKKRENVPGFAANVARIRSRIAELEAADALPVEP
jgi:hypothetical protein